MFYLSELSARTEEGASRNAKPAPNPKAIIARHQEAVTRWSKLKELYVKRRGGRLGRFNKWVPHTTNADVMQLATLWSREVQKLTAKSARDKSEHTRWKACVDKVHKTVDTRKPDAVYADNEHFWQECTGRLAIYLESRKVVPSEWALFKEAVVDTIAAVPTTIGNAGKAAAGAVGDAATTAIGHPAKLALVVLGGALLAPPLIRAIRT